MTDWGGSPGRGAWRFPRAYSTSIDPTVAALPRVKLGIQQINWALAAQGFDADPNVTAYTDRTRAAVLAFQQHAGSERVGPFDGIVGRRTARALLRPYCRYIQNATFHIPDNLTEGQMSWESGGWDPAVEGQLDPHDRGLAQINSVQRPGVTDTQAYNVLYAVTSLATEQRDAARDLGAVAQAHGVHVNPWDLAICHHKGPSATQRWAETGIVPVDGAGHSYLEYVDDVRTRASLEASLP